LIGELVTLDFNCPQHFHKHNVVATVQQDFLFSAIVPRRRNISPVRLRHIVMYPDLSAVAASTPSAEIDAPLSG